MSKFLNSSSEEEIFDRKRRQKYKQESSEDLAEDEMYDNEICPLFLEIFGTGHEYDFIYQEDQPEDQEEKEEVPLDEFECYEYVKNQLQDVVREIVELLFSGHSVEYVAFHCDKGTLKEVWEVSRLVQEYKEFSKLKKNREGQTSCDTLFALQNFKGKQADLNTPGLLDISKFVENILARERLFEPEETAFRDFGSSVDYDQVVDQISTNPIFLDRIYRLYRRNIISTFDSGINNTFISSSDQMVKIKQNIESYDLQELQKFYVKDELGDDNVLRKKIIVDAFLKTDPELFSLAKKDLIRWGQIPGENGLQEITNLLVSLQGREGNYIGAFVDKKFVKMVKIDQFGAIQDKRAFGSMEKTKILDYIGSCTNVIVTANTSMVRYFMLDIQGPSFYIPRFLSVFSDEGEFSIPHDICSLVQNPAIYFSRILHEGMGFKLNGKRVEHEIIKKAVTAAVAMNKLDWAETLKSKSGFTFFKLIEVSLTEKQYDFENIQEMAQLESCFNKVELEKIHTFFKLKNSRNKLDEFNVHPKNNSVFRILADCVANSQGLDNVSKKSQAENLNFMLRNLNLAASLNFHNLSHAGFIHPMIALEMLTKTENFFPGAPDKMIFSDVVPRDIIDHLNNDVGDKGDDNNYNDNNYNDNNYNDNNYNINDSISKSSGVITKAGPDFYLVDVHGATVYVKKTADLEVNQLVDVEILGISYPNLSYHGEIIKKPQETHLFTKHRLFKDITLNEMKAKGIPICITKSTSLSACNVVSRLDESVFLTYVLHERFENNYLDYVLTRSYKTFVFETLDDFIDGYLMKVHKFVQKIATFKYFKRSVKEASEFVQAPGETAKYALYLSRKHPSSVEMIFGRSLIVLTIEINFLLYNGQKFYSVEELANHCKRNYPNL